MIRRIFVLLILTAAALPLVAQTATVTRVSGKVEVMPPGGRWTAMKAGDRLPMGATVSTGFRSSAVLLVGRSEISVLALTRMSVEDLAEDQSSATTTLSLRTGKVRAQVRSTEGKTMDFRLRSPVSTAAVRGTDFVFDGFRLDVIEGVVDFFNALGEYQTVTAGFGSSTSGNAPPSFPEDDKSRGLGVQGDPDGDDADDGDSGGAYTGNLVITVIAAQAD